MTRLGTNHVRGVAALNRASDLDDPLAVIRELARALAMTRDRLRTQTFTAADKDRLVEVTVDGVGAPTHIRVSPRGRALGPVRLGVPVVAALAARIDVRTRVATSTSDPRSCTCGADDRSRRRRTGPYDVTQPGEY